MKHPKTILPKSDESSAQIHILNICVYIRCSFLSPPSPAPPPSPLPSPSSSIHILILLGAHFI